MRLSMAHLLCQKLHICELVSDFGPATLIAALYRSLTVLWHLAKMLNVPRLAVLCTRALRGGNQRWHQRQRGHSFWETTLLSPTLPWPLGGSGCVQLDVPIASLTLPKIPAFKRGSRLWKP